MLVGEGDDSGRWEVLLLGRYVSISHSYPRVNTGASFQVAFLPTAMGPWLASAPTLRSRSFPTGNVCSSSVPFRWANPGTLIDQAEAGYSSIDCQYGQG